MNFNIVKMSTLNSKLEVCAVSQAHTIIHKCAKNEKTVIKDVIVGLFVKLFMKYEK